jgi:hypothetical protein
MGKYFDRKDMKIAMSLKELLTELATAYAANPSLDCGDGLLPPASEEAIQQAEVQLGLRVPDELRDVLRIYGGQKCIGAGITGLFGHHRLHTPLEITEKHQMFLDNCLLDPLPEFPPESGGRGYWIPALIPFASWDAYDLCIHTDRGDIWEFEPYGGLIRHRPNIAAILRELIDAVKAGKEPELRAD